MKILIHTDGSLRGERALALGELIATGCRAEVTLLGTVSTPDASGPGSASLRQRQTALREKGVPTELIISAGAPVAEIKKCARETEFDLVVLGEVRKRNRGRFWLSSLSHRIIKGINPPVLSVSAKTTGLSRILVCSGGRSYIDKAVRLTGQIAHGVGATVTLLHVLPEPPAIYAHLPLIEDTTQRLLESSSELAVNLRAEQHTLEALGVSVLVRLRQGSVLSEILEEIEAGGYDLVVTGSAPSRSLRTYVLGDISREIVNRTQRAVLVVRGEHAPT